VHEAARALASSRIRTKRVASPCVLTPTAALRPAKNAGYKAGGRPEGLPHIGAGSCVRTAVQPNHLAIHFSVPRPAAIAAVSPCLQRGKLSFTPQG
jgi:hypothetical protein